MARKPKRRPFRRPNTQQRNEEAAYRQRSLEAAAESLLATRTPDQIRSELSERELLLVEADRAAQLDPNPVNLARYRSAYSQHQAAQVALKLAKTADNSV